MLIIPAIDIIGSKVVRLSKGNYENVDEYALAPVEQAGIFAEAGFGRIHIVDLIGSKEGKISVLEIIKGIKRNNKVSIQFGGGIRKAEDALNVLDAGADKIIIGSISVTDKEEFENIIKKTRAENIIVSADALNNEIMIKGWKEKSGITIEEHIKYCSGLGITEFLCTDISRDGMLAGPSFEMYDLLQNKFKDLKFIASGGISSLEDLKRLKKIGLYAAVTGKAIYEKKFDLKELKKIAD